jgi:hypothetical protein
MRPEHGERIGIARGRDRVEVLVARSPFLPHDNLLAAAQLIGANGAFQISFAYSAIVRSEENQPTLAVLRTLGNFGSSRRHQIAVAERDGNHVPTEERRRRTRKPSSSNEPILAGSWAMAFSPISAFPVRMRTTLSGQSEPV